MAFAHGLDQQFVPTLEHLPYGFLEDCDDCLFEAWEHMTYGGCRNEDGPGVYRTVDYGRRPYIAYDDNQPDPRNWGSFCAAY